MRNVFQYILVILIIAKEVETIFFTKTNLELYRPVVVGETVLIDCTTNIKNINLKLIQKNQLRNLERILKPDGLNLKEDNQIYELLIEGPQNAGEYVCVAELDGLTVQKSLVIYIAGKVSGDIPKPKIIKPVNTIQEGRNLVLTCNSKGTFAKLSWKKGDIDVQPEHIHNKEPYFKDGSIIVESTLTINDISLNDVGIYTCESVSRFDSTKRSVTQALVNVNGVKLYWIQNSPKTFNAVTSRRGSSAIISCVLSHPAKKVTFYHSRGVGNKRKILVDGIKYQLINDQELVVMKTSFLDIGKYICEVENKLIADKELQLFINDNAAKDPSVFVSPKSLSLDYNAADNVTCTTYGNNAKIQWLRKRNANGQIKLDPVPTERIFGRSRRTTSGYIEKVFTIVFQNATVKDTGTYICKVTVEDKPAFSDLTVFVEDPLAPEIRKFTSKVTKETNSAGLNCRSRGAPRPDVRFYKNGKLIQDGVDGYKIDYKKLSIPETQYPLHDGIYTCTASNMFGRASGTAKLMVTVAPVIDKTKEIVVVGNRKKLQITCNILRSNPAPTITWEFQPSGCQTITENCKPVENTWIRGDSAQINSTLMSSTFRVPISDATKFFIRCNAQHAYGKDSHQVFGIIDGRDAENYLKVLPEKVTIDEEQTVELKCTGKAGLFSKIQWEKNGIPIDGNDTDVSIKSSGSLLQDKVSFLTLSNVVPKQSGIYSCKGEPTRSEDDFVVSLAEVQVNKIYPPKILNVRSKNVTDGNQATIMFEIDAHPAPTISWLQNNQPIKNIGSLSSEDKCKHGAKGKYFTLDNDDAQLGRNWYKLIICKTSWEENNGVYTCIASNSQGKIEKSANLHVFASPTIEIDEVKEKYLINDQSYLNNCTAVGYPKPFVWWERKQNDMYKIVTANASNGFSLINITSVKDHHFGDYRCVASNEYGRKFEIMAIKKTKLVKVATYKSDDAARLGSLIAALVAAILIIILLTILAVILYKRRRLYGGFYILSMPPSPDFFKKLDPTKPLSDQCHKLPYFPEWEFPRNKVKIKNQVGSGAFGEVYIADANGIQNFDPRFKISMKHRPLFSKKGLNISNYFRSGRPRSSSTVSRSSVRSKSLSRQASSVSSKSTKNDLKEKHQVVAVKKLKEDATAIEYKDLVTEMKILIHIGQHENIVNMLGACTKGVEKDVMVILEFCPYGNLLSFMKERRQLFKPIWSKQHIGVEKELTTFDLCVAAYQIAKGLDFLASRKCVHRDVAARNVLVGENFVMKVADFGLARDVYQDDRYIKVSGGLLPIKWMAVESVFDRVFTQKTDVWSYGVLLWELMTLGGSPYPGIPTKDLPDFLSTGHRMDQPQFCPNEIYALMRECWSEDQDFRPTFGDIVLRVARIIESHCDPEEVSCYLDKHHIVGGSFSLEDDYLRPVDAVPGSYHFSPPPSYLQSFGDTKIDGKGKSKDEDLNSIGFRRKPSERYVPDPDEMKSNKNKASKFKNEGLKLSTSNENEETEPLCDSNNVDLQYVNDIANNNKISEIEPDEKASLLNSRVPSPVEELSNYINDEYEKMEAQVDS